MPFLDDDQLPDDFVVRFHSPAVFIENPGHETGIEISPVNGFPVGQELHCVFVQLVFEHGSSGVGKPFFFR